MVAAIPLILCKKFNATLSPRKISLIGPSILAITSPLLTKVPLSLRISIFILGLICLKTSLATSIPDTTPVALTIKLPDNIISLFIKLKVVTSLSYPSSIKACFINSIIFLSILIYP